MWWATAVIVLVGFGMGCATFSKQDAPETATALDYYKTCLAEPSKERFLDLLIACTESQWTTEDLLQICNDLTLSENEVLRMDGLVYSQAEIAFAALLACKGCLIDRIDQKICHGPLKDIISRYVKDEDCTYRFHLYCIDCIEGAEWSWFQDEFYLWIKEKKREMEMERERIRKAEETGYITVY